MNSMIGGCGRLAVSLAISCLAIASCATSQPATEQPPNVIMIVTDDLGWGDLAVYGNRRVQTPNLDRLADEGRLFTQFYVNSPVCSPSRASMLSGRFAPETGIHYAIGGPGGRNLNNPLWLDDAAPNIYDVFSESGYSTVHFGKWHLGDTGQKDGEKAPPPSAYGIDVSATTNSTGLRLTANGSPLIEETLERDLAANTSNALPRNRSTEVIIDHAIAFIESRNQHPFFMSLWTLEPHAILAPTEEQMAPYTELTHPSVKGKFWGSETVYYASLTDIDRHVGRLIDYLESAGLRENTIIVFTSDNGPSPLWSKATGHAGAGSAGPFRGVKGSLYEGGVRVPLIVSWPRQQERGIDTQTVISAIDFLPTLATLAGIDTSEIMNDRDGEDLADALTGKSALNRSKPLFWDYRAGNWGRDIQRSPRLAIRDGDWKLLMNPDGSRVELYNLANDRSETSNIADYEVEKRDEMIAELMDWFETQVPDNSNAMPFAGQKVWRAPGDNP